MPEPEMPEPETPKSSATLYTMTQMGNAGEMLVAAELTLHGVPAFTLPASWPGYDIVAQPRRGWPSFDKETTNHLSPAQRISVKTRTYASSGHFVGFGEDDVFDWLAIVLLPTADLPQRRIFIVPETVARQRSYVAKRGAVMGRGFFVHKLIQRPPVTWADRPPPAGGWGLADYEDNFELSPLPTPKTA